MAFLAANLSSRFKLLHSGGASTFRNSKSTKFAVPQGRERSSSGTFELTALAAVAHREVALEERCGKNWLSSKSAGRKNTVGAKRRVSKEKRNLTREVDGKEKRICGKARCMCQLLTANETQCSVRLNGWIVDRSRETINCRSLDFTLFCNYS